jgi:hypothetical protein
MIRPSRHFAAVEYSTSNDFPVGSITLPSGCFIGAVNVPQDIVGAVLDLVVGKRIAESDRLGAVVLATASWVRFPAGPVHDAIRVVEHVERVPVPTVPGIVGLLHPVSIFS